MGILDDLKHKAEELGEKAKEGLDVARDKAGDLVDDVRERLGHDEGDGDHAPTGESEDIGPDSSSTDAVQPGYVTGEDAEGSQDAAQDAADDEAYAESDARLDEATDEPLGADDAVLEQEGLAAGTSGSPGGPSSDADPGDGTEAGQDAPLAPVAKDVDPYDEPLSESIGSELSDADREALSEVADGSADQDS